MSEPFKKESREFVSYTGNFSEAPAKNATRTYSPVYRTDKAISNNRTGTQSDSRLESHTRGEHVNPGIENNVVIDEHFIRYVGDNKGKSVDKIAESVTRSNAGDGANFRFEYSRNGKLNAKVKLAKGRDRTSAGTLSGRAKGAGRFVEKGANAYETLFKPTGEDEIDAAFDTKTDSFFKHIQRKHLKKHDRYRAVRIKATKDIKQLKKEIKAEKKTDEQRIHDAYFNKSTGGFASDADKFSQFTDGKFAKENSTDGGEGLFLAVNASKINDAPVVGSDGKKTTYKFEDGNPSSEYGTGKSLDFNKVNERNVTKREMNKQESLEQKKAEKKAAKKQEKKEIKRAAAAASVSRMLETKKNISKELRGEQELTGDLLVDGNSGLTKTITSSVKNFFANLGKRIGKTVGSLVMKILAGILGLIWPLLLAALPVLLVVAFISSLGGADETDVGAGGYEYDMETTDSGYYLATPYSEDEISSIITSLYSMYPEMNLAREQVIRFALRTVGSPYNQNSHGNHDDNVWDCSELAYCSFLNAGIDISNGGGYCAADECYATEQNNKVITGEYTLLPGDLLFYGGSDNGRHLGVYHVSIYLGKIDGVDRMVEAYGSDRGVIVSDVRNKGKIVVIGRYF